MIYLLFCWGRSVRVLVITSEATPFAQTGGLGEVLSALPAELAKLGLHVDVLYAEISGNNPRKISTLKKLIWPLS